MMILCTGPGTFTGDELEEGKYYEAAEADTPTGRQNRAFHALLQEFYSSGAHSYAAGSFIEFRNYVKRDLGAGFESYKYVAGTEDGPAWGEAKRLEDIPDNVLRDRDGKKMIAGKLKSWADYTKKERREAIDRLVSAMIQAGVNSRKFDEIIEGMEGG
jgi:hypothetical protein